MDLIFALQLNLRSFYYFSAPAFATKLVELKENAAVFAIVK